MEDICRLGRRPIQSMSKGGAHEEMQRPLRETRRDLET